MPLDNIKNVLRLIHKHHEQEAIRHWVIEQHDVPQSVFRS